MQKVNYKLKKPIGRIISKKKSLPVIILLTFLILCLIFICMAGFNKIEDQMVQLFAKQIVKNCQNQTNWEHCYSSKLSDFNTYFPFQLSIKVLYEIQNSDHQTKKCQLIAREVGVSEAKKNPSRWLSIFQNIPISDECFTGFLNGALESKKRLDPQFQINSNTANDICNQIKVINKNNNMYPCGYALGQIILHQENYDLFKASRFCSSLQDGIKRYCLDGLFMEYILNTQLSSDDENHIIDDKEKYIKRIERVCKTFKGEKGSSCWRGISILYFRIAGPNLKKLEEYCERGIINENVQACYFRVLSISVMDKNFDKKQLSSMCERFLNDPEAYSLCYDWVITGIIYTDPKQFNLIDDICSSAPDFFKNECWVMRVDRIKMYSTF